MSATSKPFRHGRLWYSKFGKIDIVVNNAGLLNSVPLAEMPIETWDQMIRTHMRGMFLCTRFVIPQMIKQKSGKVINITGTFGIIGGADFTHLSAAKAGMIGFTQALAREVGNRVSTSMPSPGDHTHRSLQFHA